MFSDEEEIYRKRANAADPHAMVKLSNMNIGRNSGAVVSWLMQAAELGYALAQVKLGTTNLYGLDGATQDFAQARL